MNEMLLFYYCFVCLFDKPMYVDKVAETWNLLPELRCAFITTDAFHRTSSYICYSLADYE